MLAVNRRSFLTGLGSLIAAPAIVRASSLMPVRGIVMPTQSLPLVLGDSIFWYVSEIHDANSFSIAGVSSAEERVLTQRVPGATLGLALGDWISFPYGAPWATAAP